MNCVLQNILISASVVADTDELYCRKNNNRHHLHFNTFFNRFSLNQWLCYTRIERLFFKCSVHGKGCVKLFHHNGGISTLLVSKMMERETFSLPLDLVALQQGYLYMVFEPVSDAKLLEASFFTDIAHKPSCKLALVITTFNRPEQVADTVRRIQQALLSNPDTADQFALYVINNGDALPDLDTTGIVLVDNPNLGGAGGFSRGLHEACKDSSITHCVFMDDDAACEIESIRRTYALLALAKNPDLAVAGAMLYEDKPWLLFEAGARLTHAGFKCSPIKPGVDLSTSQGLAAFDEQAHIQYGGWWFYAFNCRSIRHYPFPFFVRGDDILFGMMNPHHHIVTLNGIASWQMDFRRKFSPWVHYLSARTRFITGGLNNRWFTGGLLCVFFGYQVMSLAMAYRYESALAVIEAFVDGCKGIDFWRDNADATEVRAKISAITRRETFGDWPAEISRAQCVDMNKTSKGHAWRVALQVITANGHFVPQWLFRQNNAQVSETKKSPLMAAFLRPTLVYVAEESGQAMPLAHSKKQFFFVLWRLTAVMAKSVFMLGKTLRTYKKTIPTLTTEAFWKTQFFQKKKG